MLGGAADDGWVAAGAVLATCADDVELELAPVPRVRARETRECARAVRRCIGRALEPAGRAASAGGTALIAAGLRPSIAPLTSGVRTT